MRSSLLIHRIHSLRDDYIRIGKIDHRRLFAAMRRCKGDFLMTYDNTPEIAGLTAEFGSQAKPVAMKNTHHARMTELLIARDLSWL
jgi:DNA adenine methylase